MRDDRSISDVQSRWALRPASELDAAWIADLRAVVLRADLERLGRFDPIRVRQRFLSGRHPFRLNVLQGSRARALYERNGFIVEAEDAVDVYMVRPAG